MKKVILSKTIGNSEEDIYNTIENNLNKIKIEPNFKHENVVIKPNLCYYWDYTTGQTTDPRVVSSIIEWIRSRGGNEVNISIAEADASAMKTKYAFKMLGYEKLAKEKNVELINLSKGEIIKKDIKVNGININLSINIILIESDLLINVPTLKIHRGIGLSCALKNMFGAISKPRKYGYHKILPQTIVAINKLLKPDIVVVDGIIAVGEKPKKLGLIITSNDAFATDLVAAYIVGYNPKRISYLKLAEKEGLGGINVKNMIENEELLNDFKKQFPKQRYMMDDLLWIMKLKALKLYAKISGDVIPPVLEGL